MKFYNTSYWSLQGKGYKIYPRSLGTVKPRFMSLGPCALCKFTSDWRQSVQEFSFFAVDLTNGLVFLWAEFRILSTQRRPAKGW